ncbi:MAG: glycerate kinase [Chloroflexota bacterium]
MSTEQKPFATILNHNPSKRQPIVDVLNAALAAVNPYNAVENAVQLNEGQLQIGDTTYDITQCERIFVVGAGKAGAPMTQAIEDIFEDQVSDGSLNGVVVVKDKHGGPTKSVNILEASHPIPNQAGVDAGQQVLTMAQGAGPNDLVIALLSGGGSALLVAPAEGIALADIQAMTDALLACGATINEVNCLRKHCSAVKGGQLARAVAPATLITLVLSDVIGNPLDVIASGPTVPDASTWADAWEIVERYEIAEQLPAVIVKRLQAGLADEIADTPTADDPAFTDSQTVVVADNRVAAQAAVAKAQSLGFNTLLLSTFIEGEAADVAKVAVGLGKEIQDIGLPLAPPACLILGGETTVSLGSNPGKGGRNQELALAAAIALDKHPVKSPEMTIVSLATDGTDGPTDSAGGLADHMTLERGRALGLDAEGHLRTHDAYPYLESVGDLLVTGPTQTNVNDLIFVFVQAE